MSCRPLGRQRIDCRGRKSERGSRMSECDVQLPTSDFRLPIAVHLFGSISAALRTPRKNLLSHTSSECYDSEFLGYMNAVLQNEQFLKDPSACVI